MAGLHILRICKEVVATEAKAAAERPQVMLFQFSVQAATYSDGAFDVGGWGGGNGSQYQSRGGGSSGTQVCATAS